MSNKNNNKKKIGKINPIFYGLLYVIVKPLFTKKYNITFDNEIVKDIKGPALVLATHTSDQDHILSGLSLYPVRPTYIVSEHFMRNPVQAKLMKMMHVITKKMFTPDISTVVNVMRAKKENSVIVIFAEGRQSAYAHSLPIAQGTAELIKKLGLDVYSWKAVGANLTFPKWREKGDDRIGKINCVVKPVLTAEQVNKMSIDEIREVAETTVLHDEELAMEGYEYKSETMAKGLEKILFKCPACLAEDCITTEGNEIRCSCCGSVATLDTKYRLHGSTFDRLNLWFKWQQRSMDVDNITLKSTVRLGYPNDKGFMDKNAGEGEIYIDSSEFRLSGTIHGEKIEFTVPTDKIGAFPVSPGDHFDIYHHGNLIWIYPTPNPNISIKWVCFVDRLNEIRKEKAKEQI